MLITMRIKKRRIRSLERNLASMPRGTQVVPALTSLDAHRERLCILGFSGRFTKGETVLPKQVGPISRYNAEGKYIIHRDQPKETVTRQREWTWLEWHGPRRVEQRRIVDVPYQRYPRTFLAPPSIELTVTHRGEAGAAITTPTIEYARPNDDMLLHVINLFLELFGECDLLNEENEAFAPAELRRLNWTVLPPGPMPWEQMQTRLRPILEKAKKGNRPVIEHRLRFVEEQGPAFTAVGQAGFLGYVVFGFPMEGVCVVESALYGNATYVFREDWKRLSRLTKAEIIAGDLHADRIIHSKGWEHRLTQWLALRAA